MNLSPEEVRERLHRDLGARHEPSLDVGLITQRATRTQRRMLGIASAGTTVVVVVGVVLGANFLGRSAPLPDRKPAPANSTSAPEPDVRVPTETDLWVDTKNSPPKKFIAAGRIAVSAFWTVRQVNAGGGLKTLPRSWSLYNPNTREYDDTSWAWIDVAPGLELAAVLEDMPTERVGIFDMKTRKVRTWIELDQPVGSVAWSPDGSTLLATAYDKDPDLFKRYAWDGDGGSKRTGFFLIDVASATAQFRPLAPLPRSERPTFPPVDPVQSPVPTEPAPQSSDAPEPMPTQTPGDALPMPTVSLPADVHTLPAPESGNPWNDASRQDLGWSSDGSLIWAPTQYQPDRVFYDLDGNEVARDNQPEVSDYVPFSPVSAISPNGKLAIGRQSGLPTNVVDRQTRKTVGEQNVLQLLAWADDDHLISLGGCAAPCNGKSEFVNGLFLVSVDGKDFVQLSAVADRSDNSENWLFTLR